MNTGYAMRLNNNNNNNNNNTLEQSISQPSMYKPIALRIDEYLIVRQQFYRKWVLKEWMNTGVRAPICLNTRKVN